jgi:hypothetical protein
MVDQANSKLSRYITEVGSRVVDDGAARVDDGDVTGVVVVERVGDNDVAAVSASP